jgi:hypothetical protein
VIQALLDYYKIPCGSMTDFDITVAVGGGEPGFFQFAGPNICFGRCRTGVATDVRKSFEFDASKDVHQNGAGVQLPFDFAEVIENLRLERYGGEGGGAFEQFASSGPVRKFYYRIRDSLPFQVRRQLQKIYFQQWRLLPFPGWPVDLTVDTLHEELLRVWMQASGVKKLPFIWFWPEGKTNCLVMTHDVETTSGRDFTFDLMDLDESYGFRAAYQVVPEKRYPVSDDYVSGIRNRGCEFNIHDLNHDGRLYEERSEFARRAARINEYARRYGSRGFRAGAMYRRQEWYDAFEFDYDMSVPNVAHLEPFRGGCCTVMPYFIGKILELPLTTAQDYSVFHMLNEYSIDLWKQQVALIRKKHGLVSILTHPDYLIERRERKVYETLLAYLRQLIVQEKVWETLPGTLNEWWRARNQMQIVPCGDTWEIHGPESDKARLAFAVLEGDRLFYQCA